LARAGRQSIGLWLLLWACLILEVQAQRVLPTKGFRIAENYPPPNETQIKSLVEGGRAVPLEGGKIQLSEGVSLRSFSESNTVIVAITASHCLLDQTSKTASSSGPLRLESGDGRLFIEGEGFLWSQTNSSLVISNRVHTRLEGDRQGATPGGVLAETGRIDIHSDQFTYDGLAAVHSSNVKVAGTNLHLTSQRLTMEVPLQQREVRNITAEKDVTVDYEQIHATGQRMVYSPQSGLLRLTERPQWRAQQREGRADEIILDRSNRVFQAIGNGWLRLPGVGLGSGGLLNLTNRAAKPAPRGTNQFLEVQASRYEFGTNWGVFRDQVRVREMAGEELRGKLDCGVLTIAFAGTNEVRELVAREDVRVEVEDKRFTAGQAVYTGTNGVLHLTEKPTWKAGDREGQGRMMRVDSRQEEMLVKGDAIMRLPAREVGSVDAGLMGRTNQPVQPRGAPAVAEISSEEYTLRPQRVVFRGGVSIHHPSMTSRSETLEVQFAGEGQPGQTNVLVAEKGVVFDLRQEPDMTTHGTGNRVVYLFGVTGGVTNDLVVLTGEPAELVNTRGTWTNRFRSDSLSWDRLRKSLLSGTNYQVGGRARALNTNTFKLPSK
jgi:lipopolysaccharide export system protein LptA